MRFSTLLLLPMLALVFGATFASSSRSGQASSRNYYNNNDARARCQRQTSKVWTSLKKAIAADKRKAALLVRAAFHDCITATANRPGSGCNGSLRLREELGNPMNAGFFSLRAFLAPILKGTCVSWADAFQMGTEVAMLVTGGPKVFLGRGRIDSNRPDKVGGEIPIPDNNFRKLKAFYHRKGFNVREMVVSNVGGHALGGFEGSGGERSFTPRSGVFNNEYAENLVQRMRTGRNERGFNTMSSDIAWLSDPEGKLWIKYYAGLYYGGFDRKVGLWRLKIDFARFLIKQSQLNNKTVKS